MHIAVGHSTATEATNAAAELVAALHARGISRASLVMVYGSAPYDPGALLGGLAGAFPEAALFGASSCRGVLTGEGFWSAGHRGVAAFAVDDAAGAYGVSLFPFGEDPRAAASAAVLAALADAGRPGELPALVWVGPAPGCEERVLEGIRDVLGDGVLVVGGSAADNHVEGAWWQAAGRDTGAAAVAVAVCFPSTEIVSAFASAYAPGPHRGTVDAVDGRTLLRVGGLSARAWYEAGARGALASLPAEGGVVLAATSLDPIGRVIGQIHDVPLYALAHPERVLPDGAIRLFAELPVGADITVMHGDPDTLVSRAGRVVAEALAAHPGRPAGVLLAYCGGCMMTVEPRMAEVVEQVQAALPPGTPVLGFFSFGEQGGLAGVSLHANLMISATVWAAADAP
jgi:hypothetical protein